LPVGLVWGDDSLGIRQLRCHAAGPISLRLRRSGGLSEPGTNDRYVVPVSRARLRTGGGVDVCPVGRRTGAGSDRPARLFFRMARSILGPWFDWGRMVGLLLPLVPG